MHCDWTIHYDNDIHKYTYPAWRSKIEKKCYCWVLWRYIFHKHIVNAWRQAVNKAFPSLKRHLPYRLRQRDQEGRLKWSFSSMEKTATTELAFPATADAVLHHSLPRLLGANHHSIAYGNFIAKETPENFIVRFCIYTGKPFKQSFINSSVSINSLNKVFTYGLEYLTHEWSFQLKHIAKRKPEERD